MTPSHPSKSVSRDPINYWWERTRGRDFRRKNGTAVYRAESISIDDSYEASYGFVNVLVKLRHLGNGRALTVQDSELRCDWLEVG